MSELLYKIYNMKCIQKQIVLFLIKNILNNHHKNLFCSQILQKLKYFIQKCI